MLLPRSSLHISLSRLTLTDFRNYAGLRMEIGSGHVALVGPNGAGKTNLLEAVSLLVPGRGLRNAAYAEMLRDAAPGGWAVAAEVEALSGEVAIGTAWRPAPSSDGEEAGRQVHVDGIPQKSLASLGEHMRLLWLTPAMDRLFAGPPGDRRRFFDRLVAACDSSHVSHLNAYEKAMRERNLLLSEPGPDPNWLSGLEAGMAEMAAAIAAARLSALENLQANIHIGLSQSAFPWAALTLEGEVEKLLAIMSSVHAESEFRRRLCENRRLDAAAGRTLLGPHRSDLAVVFGPKGMAAAQCSTGEQKALLIGLILAQARTVAAAAGAMPMLLLDEVTAHLDSGRRRALFQTLDTLGVQAWMTGTDEGLFEGLGKAAQFFHVEAGTVSPMTRS
ncbi:MAG: DNA replication/repair protein RecF [Rhizobiales bacterium]|nr:DNA replication/repair protein RecF [Hyphomicrobiales bacterium]